MKQLPKILNDIDRRDGMTVPEGYFADFASKMAQALPEKQEEQPAQKRSVWLRIRPYAYMAAMFAGIWLMMQMFSMIKSSASDLNIENYPAVTAALDNDHFDPYVIEIDDREILESMYNEGYTARDIYIMDEDSLDTDGFFEDDLTETVVN
ncbi:MAG: hypothetical protein K2O00_02370 [Muribaculaceae bacterium]|nr:hypothetical protein [Muribaculaceae bacterium]